MQHSRFTASEEAKKLHALICVLSLLGILLVGIIAGLSMKAHILKHELWLKDHYLVQCNGKYVRINGDRAEAMMFVGRNCSANFNLTLNQNYGL